MLPKSNVVSLLCAGVSMVCASVTIIVGGGWHVPGGIGVACASPPAAQGGSEVGDRDGGARTTHSIDRPPSGHVEEATIDSAQRGDFSQSLRAGFYRITGDDTLGRPKTGYEYTPENTPFYAYLDNRSGWNEALDSNVGRTAAVVYRTRVVQAGEGDAAAYNASVFVTGTRAGSTSFLANPAGSIVNGDMSAGADGVYLNAGEFMLDDHGHDAAGIGWVVNLRRNVGTGAKGAYWEGFRAQSIGPEAADAAFSAHGRFATAIDTTTAMFDDRKAAATLKAGQRIYLSAAASDATHVKSVGGDWIGSADGGGIVQVAATTAVAIGSGTGKPSLEVQTVANASDSVVVTGGRDGAGGIVGTTSGPLTLAPAGGVVILPRAAVDPAAQAEGAIYYNTRLRRIRAFVAGAWINLG